MCHFTDTPGYKHICVIVLPHIYIYFFSIIIHSDENISINTAEHTDKTEVHVLKWGNGVGVVVIYY